MTSAAATPVTLDSIVRQSTNQIAAALQDELVLMSIDKGRYYNLNPIAAEIWGRIARPVQVSDLCDALDAEFSAPREEITRDVLDMLNLLAAEGVLDVAPATE